MKLTNRRTAFAIAMLIAGPLSLAACNDKSADTSATATETAANNAPASDTAPAASETAAGEATDTAAAAAPSGGVVLADGTAPAERTITVSESGFSPASLTIKAGEQVTFVAPKGIFAVLVGDLSGATVNKGLIETFTFSAPGVYPVKEDLTGNTATITVE